MNLEQVVAGLVEQFERRYYGKYRGFVVDNQDPVQLGRLTLRVPSVLGPDVVTGWATPCAPYGGAANQGFLFVPEPDSAVWVEFEEGDLEFPIWVGAPWSKPDGKSQLPKPNDADDHGAEQSDVQDPPTRKTIKTLKGHTIQFEDAEDDAMILVREGGQGHLIVLGKDGVKITDATGNSIEMTSDAMTITAVVPFTIDASGQPVSIVGDTIDLRKG